MIDISLDKVAEKLLILDGSGSDIHHTGNYSEYMEKYEDIKEEKIADKKDNNKKMKKSLIRKKKRKSSL